MMSHMPYWLYAYSQQLDNHTSSSAHTMSYWLYASLQGLETDEPHFVNAALTMLLCVSNLFQATIH